MFKTILVLMAFPVLSQALPTPPPVRPNPDWTCVAIDSRNKNYYGRSSMQAAADQMAMADCQNRSADPRSCQVVDCFNSGF